MGIAEYGGGAPVILRFFPLIFPSDSWYRNG